MHSPVWILVAFCALMAFGMWCDHEEKMAGCKEIMIADRVGE